MPRPARRDQLLSLVDELGVGAIVLRQPASFAWYTGGADNRVDHDAAAGAAAVVVSAEGEWVVTDDIEADRFRDEQLAGLGIEVVQHPWHEDPDATVEALSGGRKLAADTPVPGAVDASDRVSPLRFVLDAEAIERYRALGADARALLGEVAATVSPATTEQQAAGLIAAGAGWRGAFTPVLLVGGEERLVRFRHPVPTAAPLGRRAMLVVSLERGGLYASFTAFVHFEEPDRDLQRRLDACSEILQRMRSEATRAGRALGEAFDDCRRFYAEAGFPDEWRNHHQGGLAGYGSREVIATPGDDTMIATGQAFAWNPSLAGAKAEETFVLLEDGPSVLT